MNNDAIVYVNTEDLVSNRYQPRTIFADDEIKELASSIKEVGLLHPPLVRPIMGSTLFEIIAGERRIMACRHLGYEQIPVIVRTQVAHAVSAKAALIENLQRVDLNPIEVAKAILQIMSELTYTQEEIAAKIGKKRSTVANFLRLLQLPQRIQDLIANGSISMAHAKVILTCPEAKRKQLCTQIIDKNLTVKEAENFLKIKQKRQVDKSLCSQELISQLENHFGAKVELLESHGKGKLLINFYSYDDLDRIVELCGA